MDEKTEELRDIFMDVSDDPTVTESQQDDRGSIAPEGDVAERLDRVIDRMRDRYEFESTLEGDALRVVVRRFFEGDTDADIAGAVDVSEDEVFRARMDLHLLRKDDSAGPFDLGTLREHFTDDRSVADIADDLDVSESTVRRYRRVLGARTEARKANERYYDEFAEILTDADLATRLTREAREDGLADATDGMETDVSL